MVAERDFEALDPDLAAGERDLRDLEVEQAAERPFVGGVLALVLAADLDFLELPDAGLELLRDLDAARDLLALARDLLLPDLDVLRDLPLPNFDVLRERELATRLKIHTTATKLSTSIISTPNNIIVQ